MGWATLNSGCGLGPSHNAKIKAMVVHHTAGSNSYRLADVPGIIRGIWYYHVQSRGWCDIAYNFLVDRYGGIWEGRQGGVTEPIIGGHTYGYNTDTSGRRPAGQLRQHGLAGRDDDARPSASSAGSSPSTGSTRVAGRP